MHPICACMVRFGRKVGNWGGLIRIVLVKWEGSYTDGTVIVLLGDWGKSIVWHVHS